MKKFNLTSFLVENKLTTLGRLSEMYGDSDGDHELDKKTQAKAEEHYQAGLEAYNAGDLQTAEQHYQKALEAGSWLGWGEKDLPPYGSNLEENETAVESGLSEVEEDYSKYESVEELMKEIETSTNEAAMKHKMERVKKAYESMESKAISLEEGEHASFIAPAKIKEMKRGAKELRKMHERLLKEYEKKFASKKKVDLNEAEGSDSEFTMSVEDVVAAAGTQPLRVYKRGGRVHTYDNVQDFLDFFHKNEPNAVYKQEKPGVFAAIDAPMEPGRGAPISTEPVDYQAGVQSFYDRLKYKGD